MTNEVKSRRVENSNENHATSANAQNTPVQTQQSQGGIRSIIKLVILFVISYHLFKLAPYNQLPDFDALIHDIKNNGDPEFSSTYKKSPSNHVYPTGKREERRTDTAPSVPSKKSQTTRSSSSKPKVDRQRVNQLMEEAQSLQRSGNNNLNNKIISLYEEALKLDPRNTHANLQLGLILITAMDNSDVQRKGFQLLEKTLDKHEVDNPFLRDTLQAFVLSQTIARYR